MVGTAIEFYDNYCYSIAAASYFGAIFFANVTDPVLAQIMAFTTFAVSFLARPFGSMLFGHFGDKMGRKKTLVIALLTMGIATFLVGCLPGYEQVGGASIIILCVCRACQGVGLAGEWSGAALVATENAPKEKRALYGSFPNLGAPIGFFCAYGLNFLLTTHLGQAQMGAWGWRIPFLASVVLVAIGLYVRARMSETPVFRQASEQHRTSKHPLHNLLPYWKEVVLGTLAMGITYTLFYVLGTWSLSYGVRGSASSRVNTCCCKWFPWCSSPSSSWSPASTPTRWAVRRCSSSSPQPPSCSASSLRSCSCTPPATCSSSCALASCSWVVCSAPAALTCPSCSR